MTIVSMVAFESLVCYEVRPVIRSVWLARAMVENVLLHYVLGSIIIVYKVLTACFGGLVLKPRAFS